MLIVLEQAELPLHCFSGVTESLFGGGGGAKGRGRPSSGGGGGQEDDIAMKGAQSKVQWGSHGVNGGGGGMPPHSYATALFTYTVKAVCKLYVRVTSESRFRWTKSIPNAHNDQ